MADGRSTLDQPVYLVNAEDENGDQHIFVSLDLGRGEAWHQIALKAFCNVKPNWLETRVRPRASVVALNADAER